jgi:hypothetical protein
VVEHPARSLGSSQVYKEHQHFLLNFAPPVEAALFALALLYHTIQKISYRVSNSFNQGEMNMAAASLAHSFTHTHKLDPYSLRQRMAAGCIFSSTTTVY